MTGSKRWHPWRDARERKLDITFGGAHGHRGRHAADGSVALHPTMTQAERRSTIAHELIHDERKVYPRDVVLAAREERTVETIAARRLIDLDDLVDVLRWTRHAEEAAEELWVDAPMLLALIRSLTDDERLWINMRIEEGPC